MKNIPKPLSHFGKTILELIALFRIIFQIQILKKLLRRLN